jgi:anti-anti-sigma factor
LSFLPNFSINPAAEIDEKLLWGLQQKHGLKGKELKMGIQNLAENVVLVDASAEPALNEELKNVAEVVRERGDCDVVVDFSKVDIVTSSSLSKLLKLRKLLIDCERRLVLCCVATATKAIFSVTALDGIFEMVDDQFAALASLGNQPAGQQL